MKKEFQIQIMMMIMMMMMMMFNETNKVDQYNVNNINNNNNNSSDNQMIDQVSFLSSSSLSSSSSSPSSSSSSSSSSFFLLNRWPWIDKLWSIFYTSNENYNNIDETDVNSSSSSTSVSSSIFSSLSSSPSSYSYPPSTTSSLPLSILSTPSPPSLPLSPFAKIKNMITKKWITKLISNNDSLICFNNDNETILNPSSSLQANNTLDNNNLDQFTQQLNENQTQFLSNGSTWFNQTASSSSSIFNLPLLLSTISNSNNNNNNNGTLLSSIPSITSVTISNNGTPIVSSGSSSTSVVLNNSTIEQRNGLWCPMAWDGFYCWPMTTSGTILMRSCRDIFENVGELPKDQIYVDDDQLNGVNAFAYRICDHNGTWSNNWTNYTECLLLIANNEQDVDVVSKHQAIRQLVIFIMFTCSILSLILLSITLFIFTYFRSLTCCRLRVHRNLVFALMIHSFLLLLLASPHLFNPDQSLSSYWEIEWLCKSILTLKLYSTLASINWMFIEGFQLHSRVTVSIFRKDAPFKLYHFLGWGIPLILVSAWAIQMYLTMDTVCWNGYAHSVYIWIIVGPMILALSVNCIFLVNIIRVLLTKLRLTVTIEIKQIRKAIKATALLFPLLGISHLLFCINPDDDGRLEEAYLIFNAFLQSSQGIFVSILYCFLDTDVQQVLKITYHRSNFLSRPFSLGLSRNTAVLRNRNISGGSFFCANNNQNNLNNQNNNHNMKIKRSFHSQSMIKRPTNQSLFNSNNKTSSKSVSTSTKRRLSNENEILFLSDDCRSLDARIQINEINFLEQQQNRNQISDESATSSFNDTFASNINNNNNNNASSSKNSPRIRFPIDDNDKDTNYSTTTAKTMAMINDYTVPITNTVGDGDVVDNVIESKRKLPPIPSPSTLPSPTTTTDSEIGPTTMTSSTSASTLQQFFKSNSDHQYILSIPNCLRNVRQQQQQQKKGSQISSHHHHHHHHNNNNNTSTSNKSSSQALCIMYNSNGEMVRFKPSSMNNNNKKISSNSTSKHQEVKTSSNPSNNEIVQKNSKKKLIK